MTEDDLWRARVQKDNIFRQRQLNHSEMGEGEYGTQSHAAEPYSCLQVWVYNYKGGVYVWAGQTILKSFFYP